MKKQVAECCFHLIETLNLGSLCCSEHTADGRRQAETHVLSSVWPSPVPFFEPRPVRSEKPGQGRMFSSADFNGRSIRKFTYCAFLTFLLSRLNVGVRTNRLCPSRNLVPEVKSHICEMQMLSKFDSSNSSQKPCLSVLSMPNQFLRETPETHLGMSFIFLVVKLT